jgi:hypothetical protein
LAKNTPVRYQRDSGTPEPRAAVAAKPAAKNAEIAARPRRMPSPSSGCVATTSGLSNTASSA